MRLSLDEAFRRIGIAKGDLHAPASERTKARIWYHDYLHQIAEQMRVHSPGDLSITHESVQAAIEEAYREYRRRTDRAATRSLLGGGPQGGSW